MSLHYSIFSFSALIGWPPTNEDAEHNGKAEHKGHANHYAHFHPISDHKVTSNYSFVQAHFQAHKGRVIQAGPCDQAHFQAQGPRDSNISELVFHCSDHSDLIFKSPQISFYFVT